jgi:hypothetical protein
MQRMQAFQNRWSQTEAEVKKIVAKPLAKGGAQKPSTEYESIGCDNACQAAWDAYAAKILPLMIARDTEVLQVRRAALLREKSSIAADIEAADRHLLATQFCAASQSQANQGRIQAYDGAALSEIVQIVERLQETALSAAIVTNCGPQVVKVPQAVCQ